jgi:hypothetical protein
MLNEKLNKWVNVCNGINEKNNVNRKEIRVKDGLMMVVVSVLEKNE